jgi:hypothetical protein
MVGNRVALTRAEDLETRTLRPTHSFPFSFISFPHLLKDKPHTFFSPESSGRPMMSRVAVLDDRPLKPPPPAWRRQRPLLLLS